MTKQDFMSKYDMCDILEKDGFLIDIIYATSNNFTNQVLYSQPICMIRKSTYEKLLKANSIFNKYGLKLKIWDAFRPLDYQRTMFKIYPNENFVANPDKTECNHCKGSAIDLTLCTMNNKEVKMPTEFDHFGTESYRNYYNKLDEETRKNVILLEETMIECGFAPFPYEWWHFNDTDNYDVIKENFVGM